MAEGFASGSTDPCSDSVVKAARRQPSRGGDPAPRAGAAAAAVSETAHAAASAWHLTGMPRAAQDDPREVKTAEARSHLGGLSLATADLAAHNAFSAALDAYQAFGLRNEDFATAALHDYDTLLHLKLGRYPEAGAPIDPSPTGPLGPL